MPDFPIIDSHLHIWDLGQLRYPWLAEVPKINETRTLADFDAARGPVEVEAMVFLQAEVDRAQFHDEADWVAEVAARDGRIRAMVPWAPLEKGREVEADLEKLKRHAITRGIRRIIQFEDDLEFCLRPDFIEGVRTLARHDLSFDICIDHRHMANTIEFVRQCLDVPMVLDHIGKPDIAGGHLHPWAEQMHTLARFENVWLKMSGVATEADHAGWTRDELRPFIETALEAFGAGRTMFGGDWPVATLAIDYPDWVAVLDEVLAGASQDEKRAIWRDTARSFYRLG